MGRWKYNGIIYTNQEELIEAISQAVGEDEQGSAFIHAYLADVVDLDD